MSNERPRSYHHKGKSEIGEEGTSGCKREGRGGGPDKKEGEVARRQIPRHKLHRILANCLVFLVSHIFLCDYGQPTPRGSAGEGRQQPQHCLDSQTLLASKNTEGKEKKSNHNPVGGKPKKKKNASKGRCPGTPVMTDR